MLSESAGCLPTQIHQGRQGIQCFEVLPLQYRWGTTNVKPPRSLFALRSVHGYLYPGITRLGDSPAVLIQRYRLLPAVCVVLWSTLNAHFDDITSKSGEAALNNRVLNSRYSTGCCLQSGQRITRFSCSCCCYLHI